MEGGWGKGVGWGVVSSFLLQMVANSAAAMPTTSHQTDTKPPSLSHVPPRQAVMGSKGWQVVSNGGIVKGEGKVCGCDPSSVVKTLPGVCV